MKYKKDEMKRKKTKELVFFRIVNSDTKHGGGKTSS